MLSENFLQRLDALQLAMRAPAHGGAGGLRRSRSLGSSVEFSDFREYAPGDDLRRVDWNAYARFDRLFLKLFMEEQETCVHILLDCSASMDFGEPSKWQMAQNLAQLLCYMAIRGGDRAVIIAMGQDIAASETFSGRAGFMRATDFLKALAPNGQLLLSAKVPRAPLHPGRGLCFVISDMMSEDGYETALQSLQYRKQEVSVLQVLSPWEMQPDLEGMVRLADQETSRKMEINAGQDTLKQYHRALTEHLHGIETFCCTRGMGDLLLTSDLDMEKTVLRELSRVGMIA
jgi:uncharacterized protein (DUF58 family)